MILSKFNSKYETKIEENTEELDVFRKKIGDEGLKLLCTVKFKKLSQLLLEENAIENIDCLSKNYFGKGLIALDLSSNKISNIDSLAKVDFPLLNHLFLTSNQITSINIFSKVNFPSLKELNLSANKIESIKVLETVNFPELKQLDLSKNQITDINSLAKSKFKRLEELNLDQNKISSIDILVDLKCENLKKLKLEKKNVKNIDILEKIEFKKLNYLSIGDDTLGEKVEILKKVKFGDLEDLYLYLNDNIDREKDNIQGIVNYFEEKGVTFNFISCDDDNDNDIGGDQDEFNAPKKDDLDGFGAILDSEIF